MKCTACKVDNSTATQVKRFATFNIRHHKCKSCGFKWETIEMVIDIDAVFESVADFHSLDHGAKREMSSLR